MEYATLKSKLAGLSHKLVLEVSELGMIDRLGLQELNDPDRHEAFIALDDVQLAEISSLSLTRVKVDIIKLDKAAVEQLTDGADARAIETARALASLPGLAIIGEGVETEVQAARLKDLGIEYAQGFFFSRPIPAPTFIEFFDRRRDGAARN